MLMQIIFWYPKTESHWNIHMYIQYKTRYPYLDNQFNWYTVTQFKMQLEIPKRFNHDKFPWRSPRMMQSIKRATLHNLMGFICKSRLMKYNINRLKPRFFTLLFLLLSLFIVVIVYCVCVASALGLGSRRSCRCGHWQRGSRVPIIIRSFSTLHKALSIRHQA